MMAHPHQGFAKSAHPWLFSARPSGAIPSNFGIQTKCSPKQFILLAQKLHCAFDAYEFKADRVSRSQLTNTVKVCCNDVRYFGVAAGCLLIHEKNDGLSFGGNLNGTQRNSLGEKFRLIPCPDGFSSQAQSGTV